MGALMYARGTIRGGSEFGLTVGLTVLVLTIWAALVGAILPLALSKLRVDPAVVSAPFITSFVDAHRADHLLHPRPGDPADQHGVGAEAGHP